VTENRSYDYGERRGVLSISWEQFHGLCKGLALAVSAYRPEIILAVGRGGYYPGTLLAHLLRVELYPIRLSRRERDVIVRRTPRWLVAPPALVSGARILVVDEIADTGQTLRLAAAKARELDAAEVRCAVLYAHGTGANAADYVGRISDALVVNPWDHEIVVDGVFVHHPEYLQALADQGESHELLPDATPPIRIAKPVDGNVFP
jgi:hypoxanthine phosphoribosyltransferase